MKTTLVLALVTVGFLTAAPAAEFRHSPEGAEPTSTTVSYPSPSARRVEILAASYSYGGQYVDVTAQVKTLLLAGKTFPANPGALRADPHPGMNKALVIFCRVEGRLAIFSVGEGESVSRELVARNARMVKGETPDHHARNRFGDA